MATGLFGNPTTPNPQTAATGVPTSGGIFGAPAATTAPPTTSLFGGPKPPGGTSIFGGNFAAPGAPGAHPNPSN